jgi:DNA helicase-2/ATP-dependent DNA helicase PcrA
VGDDDQSIYGWRGAEVDNILRFEKDFPGAVVVRLERNYRSTGHILAAAGKLIAHNQGRLGKTLFTDDEMGEKPTLTGAWDSEEEARLIGEEIEALQHKGHSLAEIAILVRISAQMREIEDRFVTLGLPYRVIGGPRFYERAEIRDALAYLRVVANPADDLAFERIVNVPKRGLGDATIEQVHIYARKNGVAMLEAVRRLIETDELKPKPRGTLRELARSFERWSSLIETSKHNELAEQILEESGYTDMWQKERTADSAGRLENLKELVRSMEEFPDLAAFLEHVSLVMEMSDNDTNERVSIMTLHGAKGLEFETVFLPGWEEGLFPNQRALDESGKAGLEEERRLAYVGLTRARRRAKIYFASNRRIHGLWSATVPSRFIDELPPENVDVMDAPAGFGGHGGYGRSRFDQGGFGGSTYATPGWQRAQSRGGASQDQGPGGRARIAGSYDEDNDRYTRRDDARAGSRFSQDGFKESPTPYRAPPKRGGGMVIEGQVIAKSTGAKSQYSEGERIFHIKFGNGTIASVDGNKLTIDFDKAGRKMVLDSFIERG